MKYIIFDETDGHVVNESEAYGEAEEYGKFDEGLRCYGSGSAMQRFANYRGHVEWKQHSVYMEVQIFRAFHKYHKVPCALYAAQIGCVLLVAENLDGIKREVKEVME